MSKLKIPGVIDEGDVVMSVTERNRASVLIVESDANERNTMRTALRNLNYGGFSDAPNHMAALERLEQRKFTHVIFEARKTNMPPKDFLQKILQADKTTVCIPSSFEPNVDDVFDLLIMGAKGYLCKPFTADALDRAIAMASKGEPISELVLQAKDRNEALVAIVMASLDKAATILRQASQFETAKREMPKAMIALRQSSELARTFSKGGDEALLDAMERFCIERSKGPASRLGRLRKKLQFNRGKDEPAAKPDAAEGNAQGE